jgi:5-formyltetrahydrofolate cyclo-ligase
MHDLAKQEMRQAMRAHRASFVASRSPDELQKLWINLARNAVPQIGHCKIIGSYFATGPEINPALITGALQKNATICLPRVAGPVQPLVFHEINAGDGLQPGFAGIPEPSAGRQQVVPDIVLVPLTAVDRSGHRLGQGGGYYDRTIAQVRALRRLLVVGLAYECQVVDSVPHDPDDETLDALVTPDRFLRFG